MPSIINTSAPQGSLISAFNTQPGAVTQTGTANYSAIVKATTDLLGFQATAAEQPFNVRASQLQATGDLGEADAYANAEKIAQQNAQLAEVAGGIQVVQQQRTALRTIGQQSAETASNGFKQSGSAINLLRDSLQQSYLAKQLVETQTGITAGGYLEAGAAAEAEHSAAITAAGTANELAGAEQTAADLAATNATNETAALTGYLKSVTPTPETQLVTDLLKGVASAPGTIPSSVTADIGKVTGSTSGGSVFTGNGWAPAGTIDPHTGKAFFTFGGR